MNTVELIQQYICYRQSLGIKFKSGKDILMNFQRYLGNKPDLEYLTEDLCSAYLKHPGGDITYLWFCKYSVLNGLFQWAVTREYIPESPLPTDKPKEPEHLRPYIYSDDELKRLFDCALDYKSKGTIYQECARCILQLTYFLGLRISETIKLQIGDIDFKNKCITIRESKFFKTRIVTFNGQLENLLIDFLKWRRSMKMPDTAETRLFLKSDMQPMVVNGFHGAFVKIRKKAGICRKDTDRYQPRIHDLRHTFAVRRLTTWYHEGLDVQKMLPKLSAYLGHTQLSHTSVYLTMTPELLECANDLFFNFTNLEDYEYEE